MTAHQADQLVSEYLGRLGEQLADVPPTRRDEILDEISHHIAEERGLLHNESEADLRNLLDRLGDPAELAAAARDDAAESHEAKESRRIGAIEVLALVLTPLIWPAGVILLWLSPAWNLRDKLIGTLVPPGGYLFILLSPALLLKGGGVTNSCGGTVDSQGNVITSCTGVMALPVWQQDLINVGLVAIVVVLLVLPVLTAIYMTRRLRKWSSQQGA
jgi:uncharacterized membrane protein